MAKQSGIESLIENLDQAAIMAQTNLNHAAELETEAAQLRKTAPENFDNAIHEATASLFAFAASEPPEINDRELLEGVLRINQYRPSDVGWSGPADVDGILSSYDSLQPDTPALLFTRTYGLFRGDQVEPVVVANNPVSVSAQVAVGMGGLPEAIIAFGVHKITPSTEHFSKAISKVALSHTHLDKSAIGADSIQEFIDSQKFNVREYACGHGEETNAAQIGKIHKAVGHLLRLTDLELNMDQFEATVERVRIHRSTQDRLNSRRSFFFR